MASGSQDASLNVNIPLVPPPLLFFSTQPPTVYSHPSTASYSVQQAPAVAHAVTASYSPAPVQAARPVVSAPYPAYQSHQAPPEYAYRQPEPPAPPQPTTTPQTYQVYSDMVSLFLLPPLVSAFHLHGVIVRDVLCLFFLCCVATKFNTATGELQLWSTCGCDYIRQ